MNKKLMIIFGVIVLIIVLFIGTGAFMQTPEKQIAKQNSRLVITSNSTLNVGDNITIQLTDLTGTPIKNETVNITIFGKDGSTSYNSVITNKEGIGTLSIEKSAGRYTNNATFGGNENFAGSSTSQKFIIE